MSHSPYQPLLLIYRALPVLLVLVFSACTSSRVMVPERESAPATEPAVAKQPVTPPSDVEDRLRSEVEAWWGASHRWGGTQRDGVDCSGFVMVLYRDLFDRLLPRTTAEQSRAGTPVERGELTAGDLVFFLPPTKTRHVGIYLSDGQFAHASTSQGVTISQLDQPYWQRAYWQARRVLPGPDSPPLAIRPEPEPVRVQPPVLPPASPEPDARRARRVGW
jgi:cell wall-associated NlpC family hydrolase